MTEQTVLKATELNPPLNTTLITSLDQLHLLNEFFDRCGGVTGWDIETNPLRDYFYRRCRTIQFGNTAEQYVIDLLAFCDNDPDLLFKCQGAYGKNLHLAPKLKLLLDALAPVVCSQKYLKVGVNLSFEYMSFYWLFGMRTFHFFDCAMVEKCIWAGAHSMKDYSYYSMEEMMERYFHIKIDKSLQESFTLDQPLTGDQIAYAALDTRFPMPLRQLQSHILQGHTVKSLSDKGSNAVAYLKNIDPIVTGDNLEEIAQIENNAIGAFQDMHVHGERIDRQRWLQRVAQKQAEMKKLISETLDAIFLPIVGSKLNVPADEDIEAAKQEWKKYNVVTDAEIALKAALRNAAKAGDQVQVAALLAQMNALADERKAKKEELKTAAATLGKRRTKIKNLAAKCEGNALINYSSDSQLLAVVQEMKGLKRLTSLEDETLEKYEHFPVIAAIRKYHGLAKEIGTYGIQWAMEWTTKPCKDEGWLHPGDGRLHCVFNQYDAETGRSSSEKPNGQNLPQDKEIRSCFIADPPNPEIRVSVCCDADTFIDHSMGGDTYRCDKCNQYCETKPEEYVIVTADMSGAELRIIAELADDPVWIGAFDRGEDVHSVGTELLYEEKWPVLALPGCAYYALHTAESVARRPKAKIGEPQRQKCKCAEHKELRDENKSTNFLLAYGGGPFTLAARIKKTKEQARVLMDLHRQKNPRIWAYLEESGQRAQILKKAFDMFGRRRLFPEPTHERARLKAMEDREEQLRHEPEVTKKNIETFTALHNRKPTKDELWLLGHRLPTQQEIHNAFMALHSSIERQGKNHSIQGTNATIAKIAMGAGHDNEGKPFLWHTLPQYRARLVKFVHDELVVQCPKRFSKQVVDLIGDAFRRAAAMKMKKVVMEFDANVATYWKK